MKRVFCFLLCLSLLCALFACETDQPLSTSDNVITTSADSGTTPPDTVETTIPDTSGTTVFVDSAGRSVAVPAEITRVAPSGSVAQMILMTLCPELLVGLASDPSETQKPYFPEVTWELPTFGQFYGSKANLNMEALIAAEPQIIIDLGDPKGSIREDMDMVQEQTGIPTVFIQATLDELPDAYRTLGELLDRQEEAEALAAFVEKTLTMAAENRGKIAEDDRITVMFGTGASGLACNAAGSSQADVIDRIGAVNAIVSDEISNKNGGTEVDLEQVYVCDPDVILLAKDGPYDTLAEGEWAQLRAVRNGAYYEIPDTPYSWMSMPPSVNRVLGIWWLGNLLYPELYDYDMAEIAQEYYALFWHYDLSAAEAETLLSRSTLK